MGRYFLNEPWSFYTDLICSEITPSFCKFQSHNKLIGVRFEFALICSAQMQISGRKETLMILFSAKNVSRQQVSHLENYSGHHSTPPIRSCNNVFLVFILSGVPLFHFYFCPSIVVYCWICQCCHFSSEWPCPATASLCFLGLAKLVRCHGHKKVFKSNNLLSLASTSILILVTCYL